MARGPGLDQARGKVEPSKEPGTEIGKVEPWQLWYPNVHIRLKWALALSVSSFPRSILNTSVFLTETKIKRQGKDMKEAGCVTVMGKQ